MHSLVFFSPDTDILVLVTANYDLMLKNHSISMVSGVMQDEPLWQALGKEKAKTTTDNIQHPKFMFKLYVSNFKLFSKRQSELSDQQHVKCIVCFTHIVDVFQCDDQQYMILEEQGIIKCERLFITMKRKKTARKARKQPPQVIFDPLMHLSVVKSCSFVSTTIWFPDPNTVGLGVKINILAYSEAEILQIEVLWQPLKKKKKNQYGHTDFFFA